MRTITLHAETSLTRQMKSEAVRFLPPEAYPPYTFTHGGNCFTVTWPSGEVGFDFGGDDEQ